MKVPLGGTFLFVTAYFSWRNLKATEEKQITERYSKSIEQLGDDKIEVRLGGIYALERIAKDSPKDHWTIMEVLTSFVREKSPLQQSENLQAEETKTQEKLIIIGHYHSTPQKITTDVQAALTVIGRRDFDKDQKDKFFDLSFTPLFGAHLREAHLRKANLRKANLGRANLSRANLWGADLSGANLGRANLGRANLSRAYLIGANLTRANLWGADLTGAHLSGADLTRADLTRANLTRANLWGADLSRAYLGGAHLSGADLRNAKNSTLERVKSANNWEQAKFDADFRMELGLPTDSTTEEEDNFWSLD